MASPKKFAQAYQQAPWRLQTQRGVLFLIAAILSAATLWVLVSVTVQAAAAGLELQDLEYEQEVLQREIAGLQTEIAVLTSQKQMETRAAALGFVPIDPAAVTYLVVPGYYGREPVIHAPPTRQAIEQPIIKPAYTQSLWEWLLQGVLEVSEHSEARLP